jgi:hypothetical protein
MEIPVMHGELGKTVAIKARKTADGNLALKPMPPCQIFERGIAGSL